MFIFLLEVVIPFLEEELLKINETLISIHLNFSQLK